MKNKWCKDGALQFKGIDYAFFRNMINCPLVRLGLIINCDIYNICDNLNEYETEGCYSVMPKSYKYTVCPICRERLFNMFIRENE